MSKGLGCMERRVLRTLEQHPGKWVRLMTDGAEPSRASSVRRAAHSLERKGLVRLRKSSKGGVTRLAARIVSDDEGILPEDLARLMPERNRNELLASYGAGNTSTPWDEQLERIRESMREYLWESAVRTGMDIEQITGMMAMMAQATNRTQPTQEQNPD